MSAAAAPARPPLWRNVRVRRVVGQVVVLVLVLVVAREAYLNLQFNAEARNEQLGFGFLDARAGFGIPEGIEYDPNNPVSRAFVVGFVNTLRVALIGIVLASILGLFIGIARLSSNWLVRKTSQGYVELFRNTPVAVQVVFWWTAVFLAIPTIEDSLSFLDITYLSNRGWWVPWFELEDGAALWGWFLLAAFAVAAVLWVRRTRLNERTGRPHHRVLWSLGAFLAISSVGFVVSGAPVSFDVPVPSERAFTGGLRLTTEFSALLIALVVYTAAFIAEIVRGSIQAVPKGQHEAAEALGLSRGQQLRRVILPQALRIGIPALNSQYLNLVKNSSLGILISYFELTRVTDSIITGRGHALQALFLLMLTYLAICLAISFVMNQVNRAVTARGTA